MIELLKVIVQPVVIERDEDGKIVGERLGEPAALYSEEQVHEYYATLQEQLKPSEELV